MPSFIAVLSLGTAFATDLKSFEMEIEQAIDTLGRPASPTFGGVITMSFNTPTDPFVTEWMFEPAKQMSGTVTMLNFSTACPMFRLGC